jgi:hypothetical protein
MEHQDLLAGFIRLHILHHAVEGTFMVNGSSRNWRAMATSSRPARSTRREALELAKGKIRELVSEVIGASPTLSRD